MAGRNVFLAAVAAMLFAGCYAAIKAGLAYAPPFQFAAMRSLVGGLTLLSVLAVARHPLIPARRLWPAIALLALVGPTIGFGAMFSSPMHTGAGLASVVGNTGPLLVIVLAAFFLDEPITRGKLTALVLGIGGVVLIGFPSASGRGTFHGTALMLPLLAAGSGATESLIVKRVQPGLDVLGVAAWQFVFASLPLFMLSGWLEPQREVRWTPQFALLLGLLAGGTTAAASGLWYWLVQREEVSRLSLMLFLVPVAGLLIGIKAFGEVLAPIQAAGISLVVAGVAAAGLSRTQTASVTPDVARSAS